MRFLRPHPVVWLHRTMRTWWPFFVSMAAVALIATMGWVAWTVVDERRHLDDEAARDRRQDERIDELLELVRADATDAQERLAGALRSVEETTARQFADHDRAVNAKLNELLDRIAALLQRPAGEPLDPVTAQPYLTERRSTSAARPQTSAPAPAPSPAPSPDPTTPDQRNCAKRPSGPRC